MPVFPKTCRISRGVMSRGSTNRSDAPSAAKVRSGTEHGRESLSWSGNGSAAMARKRLGTWRYRSNASGRTCPYAIFLNQSIIPILSAVKSSPRSSSSLTIAAASRRFSTVIDRISRSLTTSASLVISDSSTFTSVFNKSVRELIDVSDSHCALKVRLFASRAQL